MKEIFLQSQNLVNKYPPKYWEVFSQILLAYLSIAFLVALNLNLAQTNIAVRLPIMMLSGILIAGFFHYLFLFLHEAGHHNILPNKFLNDLFGNLFLSFWFFQEIKLYRKMHWDHHLKHGQKDDPENFYFSPLSFKNLIFALIGISGFLKAIDWDAHLKKPNSVNDVGFLKIRALAVFIFYQSVVFSIFFYFGALWQYLLIWFLPLFFGFPFLAFIRQVCEHRKPKAGSKDFFLEEHGPYSRVFKISLLSNFLGGAGFRQHWYHHYNPYISCTRLDEYAEEVNRVVPDAVSNLKQTTYLNVTKELIEEAWGSTG